MLPGKSVLNSQNPKGIAGNITKVKSDFLELNFFIASVVVSIDVIRSVPIGRCGPCSSNGLIGKKKIVLSLSNFDICFQLSSLNFIIFLSFILSFFVFM